MALFGLHGKADSAPPDLAIVTPVVNGLPFIDETIAGVVGQAGDFTIRYHVKDGGSADGTVDRLQKWAKWLSDDFPIMCRGVTFSYASKPDNGLYEAVNEGFRECGPAKYMSWINADDRYEPGAFASAVEIFEKFPDVDWLGGRPVLMSESGCTGKVVDLRGFPRKAIRARIFDGRFSPFFLQQEGMFWRTSLWQKVGPLKADMRLAGDFDLWTRFAEHADFVVADAFLGTFRVRAGQLSVAIDRYHQEIDRALSVEAAAHRAEIANAYRDAVTVDAILAAGLEWRIAQNRVFADGWHIATLPDPQGSESDPARLRGEIARRERELAELRRQLVTTRAYVGILD
jgi:glycosyltransferase involved in cell wall biosynthesis